MNKILLLILVGLSSVKAQKALDLATAVQLAKEQSVGAKIVQTTYSNKYWAYKSFKSNYLPQLSLNGTFPNLDRGLSSITLDDGSDTFIQRSLLSSTASVGMSQNIGLTGSTITVGSNVSRIDLLSSNPTTSYLFSPVSVSLRQPLFGFNSMKWNLKMEPVKFDIAKKAFNENMEEVALQTARMFFNVLVADVRTEMAEKALAMNDTLLKITTGRYNLGKIAENELLQMKLQYMRSQADLEQAKLDRVMNISRLKNHLGLDMNEELDLIIPQSIPEFTANLEMALTNAKLYRSDLDEFERQRIDAEMQLAQSRKNNSFSLDLYASYGLNVSGNTWDAINNTPDESQRFFITASVPIVDWGKGKASVKTAEAMKELVELQNKQGLEQFEQDVILAVNYFNMKRTNLQNAILADDIAQKQFNVTVQRFKIGKIGIIELNQSITQRDNAKSNYLSSLMDFWISYYDLRLKSLYDFETESPIDYLQM